MKNSIILCLWATLLLSVVHGMVPFPPPYPPSPIQPYPPTPVIPPYPPSPIQPYPPTPIPNPPYPMPPSPYYPPSPVPLPYPPYPYPCPSPFDPCGDHSIGVGAGSPGRPLGSAGGKGLGK